MERIPSHLEGVAWHRVKGVPLFTTHRTVRSDGQEYNCDDRELYSVTGRLQGLEKQGFAPSIVDGHLTIVKDGKATQRAAKDVTTFGFNVQHRVEEYAGRKWIIADQLLYPDKVDQAKQYPHRSVEFIHAWGIYDPCCLIPETPRLNQLGVMLPVDYERGYVPQSRRGGALAVPVSCYSLGGERTFYSLRMGNMNPELLSCLQGMQELIAKAMTSAGTPGQTPPAAAAATPAVANGTTGVDFYALQKDLVDTKLDNAKLKIELDDTRSKTRISDRRGKVEELARTRLVEVDDFLKKYGGLDDGVFNTVLEDAKTLYSLRDGNGRQVPPLDGPGGGKGVDPSKYLRQATDYVRDNLLTSKNKLDIYEVANRLANGLAPA